ncbi:phospholipase [Streptomyces sp. NPDC004609]|uniref:phospholipase n=1 Tax=Streptomyces sp. NPDC004609 TaxID=3364704 RepID=UPI0036B40DA3
MRRRLVVSLTATSLAVSATLVSAGSAAAVPADKPRVLSSWTQTSAASYSAFFAARANQSAWAAYRFDWSTDHCTGSPDNPFGFPFKNSCVRHDFAYRNYKAAGTYDANKARVDSAFHADMKRVCARYTGVKKASCSATAWTYYQAVVRLG